MEILGIVVVVVALEIPDHYYFKILQCQQMDNTKLLYVNVILLMVLTLYLQAVILELVGIVNRLYLM